eukprot:jgi/Bigna1/83872/fgenesh1_pg.117_\
MVLDTARYFVVVIQLTHVLQSHRAYYSGVAVDCTRELFRITALEACGRRIVLGCSDGLIRVFEDRSQPNGKVDYKPTSVSEVFTKKMIDHLEVFPLQGVMLSLSDQTVRFHSFPSLETRGAFEKSRGACLSFVSNHSAEKKGDSELLFCIALKRRVQMFQWNARDFTFSPIKELSLNETPRKMAFAGAYTLCCAFKRDYKMLDTKTGKVTPIFPLGRKEPFGIKISEEAAYLLVLLAKNQQGICVDHEGKPTRTEPLDWPEVPNALVFSRPYVLSTSTTNVDVRNVENRSPVQNIPLKNATMLASTYLGERMIVAASPVMVVQLTPVSPLDQVEELVAKSNFEAALQLIEEDLDSKWVQTRSEHRLKVKTQYAYHLYNNREFQSSLHLFQETKVDPRQVLALFPKIIPKGQCRKIEHPVEHIVPIEESGDVIIKALLAFLKQETECDLDLTEEILTKKGKYKELVAFFKSREEHEKALILLKKLARSRKNNNDTSSRGHRMMQGPDATIEYLQSLVPDRWAMIRDTSVFCALGLLEYQDIVIKYAEWVVKDYPQKGRHDYDGDDGLLIFTQQRQHQQQPEMRNDSNIRKKATNNQGGGGEQPSNSSSNYIPARLVLKLLKSWCGPDIVVTYLESYLKNTSNKNSALHNELVFLYLDLIRRAKEGKGSSNNKKRSTNDDNKRRRKNVPSAEHIQVLRTKLIRFLRESMYYKPELMLGRFPESELLEERAVLLSRLNEHREALAIYVWDLNLLDDAIKYCGSNYDESHKEQKHVYLHLMHVLLDPSSLEPTPARVQAKPNVEEAVKLIAEHYARMDTSSALDLLPDDLDVKKIFPILKAIFSHNKTRSRRNQVTKSLYRIENLRVCFDTYIQCSRRIGNAAFVRYPKDEVVVHYVCSENFQASVEGM